MLLLTRIFYWFKQVIKNNLSRSNIESMWFVICDRHSRSSRSSCCCNLCLFRPRPLQLFVVALTLIRCSAFVVVPHTACSGPWRAGSFASGPQALGKTGGQRQPALHASEERKIGQRRAKWYYRYKKNRVETEPEQ